MMRLFFLLCSLHFFSLAFAQTGDELLVYSLKGNVTVLENNKESKVKIGKVIKSNSTIKTQRDSKLTMVCKEGRPISVTREGIFPAVIWKDSCSASHSSVTSKYFQYIWDQLYVRSDDYRSNHPDGMATISEAPVRGNEEREIVFVEELDTVNYAAGLFPLSWTTSFDYSGKYHFILTNTKTKKVVYQDSSIANTRQLNALKPHMKTGNSYSWSVSTKETGLAQAGIINYLQPKLVNQHILQLKKNTTLVEEIPAQSLRLAYMLRQDHYLADAYVYYTKAAVTDPSTNFYTEMLEEFKLKFSIH